LAALLESLAVLQARVRSPDIDLADLATNNIEAATLLGAAASDFLRKSVSAGDFAGDSYDAVSRYRIRRLSRLLRLWI